MPQEKQDDTSKGPVWEEDVTVEARYSDGDFDGYCLKFETEGAALAFLNNIKSLVKRGAL